MRSKFLLCRILPVMIAGCLGACARHNNAPLSRASILQDDLQTLWRDFLDYHPASQPEIIVAHAGPMTVTTGDLQNYLNGVPEPMRAGLLSTVGRQTLLMMVIRDIKIPAWAAAQVNLEAYPVFRQKLYQIVSQGKEEALRQTFLDSDKICPVSDQEIQAWLNTHKVKYEPRYRIQASLILLGNLKDAQKAARLLANHTPFEQVAKSMSIDKTAPLGGVLPLSWPEQQKPDVLNALLALHDGQVSKIVQIAGGYAILKKHGESLALSNSPEELNKRILTELKQKKLNALLENYLKDQKVQTDVHALNSASLH